MADKKKKISALNDDLDVGLLLAIARENIIAVVVFFSLFMAGALLYLRFTAPIYQAGAVVQLGHDTRQNSLLQTQSLYDQSIHEEIEVLRQRVLSRIPEADDEPCTFCLWMEQVEYKAQKKSLRP